MKQSIIILLLLFLSYPSQGQDIEKIKKNSTIHQYLNTASFDKKLYIRENSSKNKKKIKIDAVIEVFQKDQSQLGKLKLVTDHGLYMSLINIKSDSIEIDTLYKRFLPYEAILEDTLIFCSFQDITKIGFTNNLSRKYEFASFILGTGIELIILPIIIPPLMGAGFIGFFSSPLPYFIGAGIFTTYIGSKRRQKLQKLMYYSLESHHIHVKTK